MCLIYCIAYTKPLSPTFHAAEELLVTFEISSVFRGKQVHHPPDGLQWRRGGWKLLKF